MSQEDFFSDNDSLVDSSSAQCAPISGLIEREYEKLIACEIARKVLSARKTVVDLRIDNSLLNIMAPDRIKHENDVRHMGTVHWRQNRMGKASSQ